MWFLFLKRFQSRSGSITSLFLPRAWSLVDRSHSYKVINGPGVHRLGLTDPIKCRNFISPDLSSSLRWAQSHIYDCTLAHGACEQGKTTRLPRRVLSFQYGPDNTITVRLEDYLFRPYGRYAALSHCWGSHQTLVTTTDTINERRRGIPWYKIPKTFQDSIKFCLGLSIKYLWIDALCIVQDDTYDWEVESANMGRIFQNSYITLAATNGQNDTSGLFSQSRSDFAASPLRMSPNNSVRDDNDQVLQVDRSRRTIHTSDVKQSDIDKPNINQPPSFLIEYFGGWFSANGVNCNGEWHRVIEQFSRLTLTRQSDCLPALSGLAQRFGHGSADYLAGLWASSLAFDLLWRVDKLEDEATRQTTYRGPSWSW
ncbi:hypothetical protein PG984_005448, partial [Apiospora sp. TS-2023a]